ncbi:PREDICTED: uncharacterized protein LOC109242482 [Nicotiana attenuata]|uniref:uncharacterized protein LOC109242482 n=1 Tax=Nicotiana attenuata TaxID=49451 RepID=UPI0009045F03|nr:PREDICTED: uncharacterized protein LOC109242482 [Nicotiana attenuata]
MRMFKWSPDFDPNEETSLAPIWVLLPELPFHMFKWEYLKQVLEQIGTPMKEDITTIARTRPHMAKVRVEVDLMKALPDSVFVGIKGDTTGLKGRDQKLEYEGVPAFCKTCKLQGHDYERCKVEARKREQARANQATENAKKKQDQARTNIVGETGNKATEGTTINNTDNKAAEPAKNDTETKNEETNVTQGKGELNNKHGLDIDNNSIYESGEDINSNQSHEASTDDEIANSSIGGSEDD